MTPKELAGLLGSIPPEQLAQMPHSLLYQARQYASPQMQGLLAPAEHQAFAREATAENPLLALPIAAGTLAYQPYKALMGQSRSSPSWEQVMGGLSGVAQGLGNRFSGLLGQ